MPQRMLTYLWQPSRREVAVERGEGVRLVERVAFGGGEDEAVDGGYRVAAVCGTPRTAIVSVNTTVLSPSRTSISTG